MNKKIKGIVASGASVLVIIIAAIFGINLSSEKTDHPPNSSDVSVTTTSVLSAENDEIQTTAASQEVKTGIRKTTAKNPSTAVKTTVTAVPDKPAYHFKTEKLLNDHFDKHSIEFKVDFGYKTAEEYETGASNVINNPDALYKTEAEDGDGIYYIEATNEFVVLSTDGYIRTYFRPGGRKEYFDRQ